MTARILTALCASRLPSPGHMRRPTASAAETPPDQKAYIEAMKITDPEKKIAALEKLKTDFPDSTYAVHRRYAESSAR